MTVPLEKLSDFLLFPDLKFIELKPGGLFICQKTSEFEVCPRCATPCRSIYDHREVRIRDAKIRDCKVVLQILKRRFMCKTCRNPFTEPVPGVLPGRRSTQRFRVEVMHACAKYSDLSQVKREFGVSYDFIYSSFYERLELNLRERRNTQWPSAIGIDEHRYGRRKNGYGTQFVSIIVNQNSGKMFEVVQGRSKADLYSALFEVEGRENVRWVTMDLSETYRSFISEHFPNAKIVADKFHVIRLLSPHILKERRAIAGSRAAAKARRLLLVSSRDLSFFERSTIREYLKEHPKLEELYLWKERIHQFYRSRSYYVAWRSLRKMIDEMSVSFLPEIQTLRRTLIRWQEPCLNYFLCRLTNGPLEGFNNKASVLKRRAYGYRNPDHYRLQLLNACS